MNKVQIKYKFDFDDNHDSDEKFVSPLFISFVDALNNNKFYATAAPNQLNAIEKCIPSHCGQRFN